MTSVIGRRPSLYVEVIYRHVQLHILHFSLTPVLPPYLKWYFLEKSVQYATHISANNGNVKCELLNVMTKKIESPNVENVTIS